MALDTYANLQTSVASWLDRSDLTAQMPDFIALFEANANTDPAFKAQYNRTYSTITSTANVNYITYPTDFLSVDSLILTNAGLQVPVTNYGTGSALYTAYPSTSAGVPKGFIVTNGKLIFAPTPDAAYSMVLYYYQKIAALSTTNTTNWLLTNYPQTYLFGTLVAAESYLGNDQAIQKWGNLYDNSVQKLQGATDRNKYSGGPLTVKVDAIA